ncbi:unnamed protein product [Rhizoctonia solani]|uniref:BTB domain-containing protein n=1 Tax=Rhizoctonia solani TaxID=456999 RepID=A0A8H3BTH2_9AGAM|nr:unnamed protein product [Rhizoctonia solani]
MESFDSPLSTPVIPPSVASDIERTHGKPDELKLSDPTGHFGSSKSNAMSDIPTVIDLGDGDIELKVNNTVFKSHKHLLNDFGRLREMIKGMERHNAGTPCITIYRDERGVEDFKNMFKVLYASLIKGPFEFDGPTLVSSLRLATAYEYPELRNFSVNNIDRLGASAFSPIQRIQLAREFDLTTWDESAFQELATRDEPITKEEARELGFEKFQELAQAREEVKWKRGAEEEKLKREAEEQKKREEEQKRREEEAQRQREEEGRKKREEEERLRKEEEERKRQEEERKKREEEERVRKEEEERKRKEEEERKKREDEERAKQEAAEKAKQEAEAKAKQEAEEKAKQEAEEKAKKEAEEKAKQEAENK